MTIKGKNKFKIFIVYIFKYEISPKITDLNSFQKIDFSIPKNRFSFQLIDSFFQMSFLKHPERIFLK
jgi:hypothetical protein